MKLEEAFTCLQAHSNTVFHCRYDFCCLGYLRMELAHINTKSAKTIDNWINMYARTGTYQRADTKGFRRIPTAITSDYAINMMIIRTTT
ncbi:hypothetical protein PHMEG_0004782 [Phytophthora megakarya]|uniref:Uncharacterized protein n=1 Tax=Phytophthora megakarya TaxID=4795 RepID=A0A225WT00_9STRA|nr:hypothetical protein PHMEG_0004782 [Phytophthora megakarya]